MKFLIFITLLPSLLWASVGPDLAGLDLKSGKSMSLNLKESKIGTVVVFLSSTCPCSNQNISYLIELSKKWKDYTFLGVHSNTDESPLEAMEYFAKKDLPFPVLQDQKAKIANSFQALRTPHSFVVSLEGEILYRGGVTDSSNPEKAENFYLENALAAYQNKKKIEPTETRVLGCEITRD